MDKILTIKIFWKMVSVFRFYHLICYLKLKVSLSNREFKKCGFSSNRQFKNFGFSSNRQFIFVWFLSNRQLDFARFLDDWSDPEYDLSEDESETDSSFDGRVDGFMTIQPRLQKNSEDEDRISATTSTPCLKQNGLSSSDLSCKMFLKIAKFE